MTFRNLLHRLHNKLIVVYCNIRSFINRCQLMLGRCCLIMLRFCSNAKLPEFQVNVLHISTDSLPDGSKIMIIHFLTFRSRCTKKCPSGKNEVRALQIIIAVYKKIFLFRTNAWCYLCCFCISKQTYNTKCLFTNGFHGTKQWSLCIQCLPFIGAECRRNAENYTCCIFTKKCRGGNIPCRIASCFKCRTQST